MQAQSLDIDKYEKFIFDLDGTLLFGNYEEEKEYFIDILKENGEPFFQNLMSYLDRYEKTFLYYSPELLSVFLSVISNTYIRPNVIDKWIDINCNMKDKIEPSAIETLEYLKSKNKSIVVLTNWFTKTQKSRLINSNLMPYIDAVYGGDLYLKPHVKSYISASNGVDIDKCIMIGDDLEKDYLGPRKIGMHSILYDCDDRIPNEKNKIKSLKKIIE